MHTTPRLRLLRPESRHAEAIYASASDPDVTRWVGWPRHRSMEDTASFLAFSDAEWQRAAAGPLVIEDRETGEFVGTTGLSFEASSIASTGYVIRREAWGQGYATEALLGVIELADPLEVVRLSALCHPGHRASARVLEKAGFELEGVLRRSTLFPNLEPDTLSDACLYARILADRG